MYMNIESRARLASQLYMIAAINRVELLELANTTGRTTGEIVDQVYDEFCRRDLTAWNLEELVKTTDRLDVNIVFN